MKKIDSIHFGLPMLASGLGLLLAVPGIYVLVTGRFSALCLLPGALVLAAFGVLLAIEMRQDNGKVPYYEKHLTETIPYDPERQIPVIRASICTGERVAGFRDRQTGRFTEVMVLHSEEEKSRFLKLYGLTEIRTEY